MARIRTAPRKAPTQQRSRATVDAIVDATARVLVRDGYDALSTNKVASEAGVSVGSLYQYFPGKEALVAAVMERHSSRMQENIAERMRNAPPAATPEEVATELIRAMLAALQAEPRLHRVLVEQVPRIGALRRLHELFGNYERLVEAWLEANADRNEIADAHIASFVLMAAVEGLVNRAALDRPDLVATGRLEEHILRLVLGYVVPSYAAQASAEGRYGGKRRG
ncbi:MAG TPA: TetR/AcrR family transcriptional regulator [Anaeromyxobacteraceae bacterium]|nr:TetR/AcrR family transcriptional regulator [Anaeromyxobacteraceae bacterium]